MMPENWRVPAATFFAVALVIGAYLVARDAQSPAVAQASAETALLRAIAARDTDQDGLSDWEEALYGTDPRSADSSHLGMTDGEAVAKGLIVPKAIADMTIATSTSAADGSFDYAAEGLTPPTEGTLTASFAQDFFSLYLAAKSAKGGADLSEDDIAAISEQALQSLTTAVAAAPDYKSRDDLAISGSGAEALRTFAVRAEAVLLKNTSEAANTGLGYLRSAIEDGDATAYTHLASMAQMYRRSAVGLAMLSVPKELAADDLLLINTLMRMSEIDSDFARADIDPLAAIIALKQYLPTATALGQAFIHIGDVYANADVTFSAGSPGASFVNVIADVTASQQEVEKP